MPAHLQRVGTKRLSVGRMSFARETQNPTCGILYNKRVVLVERATLLREAGGSDGRKDSLDKIVEQMFHAYFVQD